MKGLSTELLEAITRLRSTWSNLFILETKDGFFIFRPTTKGEFTDFSSLFESIGDEVEDQIFEKCVLYPKMTDEDVDGLYAGTITSVADAIVSVSGFSDEDVFLSLLEENRTAMNLVDNQILAVLMKAFPYLTIEDINKLDIQQYTYRVALAEIILGTTLTIQKQEPTKNNTGETFDFEKENMQMFGKGAFSGDDFI
jgi:hypothetical protein